MKVLAGVCAGLALLCGAGCVGRLHAQAAKADAVLVLKKEHVLELLRSGKVIRTYKVALGRGGLEAK